MGERTIIDAVERFAINRGWNLIQCDNCGVKQALERSTDVQQVVTEARDRGWLVLDEPRRDLCPVCAEGVRNNPWLHDLKSLDRKH